MDCSINKATSEHEAEKRDSNVGVLESLASASQRTDRKALQFAETWMLDQMPVHCVSYQP